MILAATWEENLTKILIAVLSSIITLSISGFLNRRKERAKIVRKVADNYIKERRLMGNDDSPEGRLGTMQRAGVALFKSEKELDAFLSLVTAQGCSDPLAGTKIERCFERFDLPKLLRETNARGTQLAADMAFYRFLLIGLDDRETKEAEEKAKRGVVERINMNHPQSEQASGDQPAQRPESNDTV